MRSQLHNVGRTRLSLPPAWLRVLAAMAVLLSSFAYSEPTQMRVGLEPFPPLINEDGSGHSVHWLQAIAEEAGLELHVSIMPYSRAKLLLSAGDLDLIGHTPYGLETSEFYEYAREIDHRVPTRMDVFSLEESVLSPDSDSVYIIGTPFGNAEFLEDLLKFPETRITEGRLPNLVRMMLAGRIHAVAFERIATASEINRQTELLIHYRKLKEINAGFAVHRDNSELLQMLNKASEKIDADRLYLGYTNELQWPEKGILMP